MPGDGTVVAVYAPVVPDLEKKGSVAESAAAFDAFSAGNTQAFIDYVFVIGIFDKSPNDGARGTEPALCGSIQVFRSGLKESAA